MGPHGSNRSTSSATSWHASMSVRRLGPPGAGATRWPRGRRPHRTPMKTGSTRAGGVWIAGRTNNGIVASVDALQPQPGGNDDAFVTHVGSDGSVVYSPYLGGSGVDAAYGIARDATGNIYVAGGTNSTNFPVTPD